MEGSCYFGEAWYPSPIEVHEADELLDSMNRHWFLPLYDHGDLLLIHFEALFANINTQELQFRLVECALLQIAGQLCFLKEVQDIPDPWDMFSFSRVVDEDVVNVTFYIPVQHGA